MTERVRLVPWAEAHLGDVAALCADPDVLRYTRIPDQAPPDFPRRWLDHYEEGRRDGTRDGFAAVGNAGRFLGLALAPKIDREAREVELGYIVVPAARGQGIATELLGLLTGWAFAEARALRIRLVIDVSNTASARVAERCGYVDEGVMRSVHFKGDARIDVGLWARLASERWRRHPGGLTGPPQGVGLLRGATCRLRGPGADAVDIRRSRAWWWALRPSVTELPPACAAMRGRQ